MPRSTAGSWVLRMLQMAANEMDSCAIHAGQVLQRFCRASGYPYALQVHAYRCASPPGAVYSTHPPRHSDLAICERHAAMGACWWGQHAGSNDDLGHVQFARRLIPRLWCTSPSCEHAGEAHLCLDLCQEVVHKQGPARAGAGLVQLPLPVCLTSMHGLAQGNAAQKREHLQAEPMQTCSKSAKHMLHQSQHPYGTFLLATL